MLLGTFTQQPSDRLDYDIEASLFLDGGDTISSASVNIEGGTLILDAIVRKETSVKLWLSGGTDGETNKVTVTLTTAAGRIKQDEFRVKIKER